jgi:hypothetical protein
MISEALQVGDANNPVHTIVPALHVLFSRGALAGHDEDLL